MSAPATIAVTGANGYVGSLIVRALSQDHRVLELVRRPVRSSQCAWSFDDPPEALAQTLRDHDVEHLVHAAWDMATSSADAIEASCVAGSASLLRACASAGVGRLTFISTISAFEGARSTYGRSKLEVERMFLDAGGVVLRLGLVYGQEDRGLIGRLRRTARGGWVAPLIGRGRSPQYLLHERTLAAVISSAAQGAYDGETRPITLADPQPIPFRRLLRALADAEGRRLLLVPVPWKLLYGSLRMLEGLGLRPSVRSDSVLSFVYQDPEPDFEAMRSHGINPVPVSHLMGLGPELAEDRSPEQARRGVEAVADGGVRGKDPPG